MLVLIRQAKIIDIRSEFHNKIVDILIEDGIIKEIGASLDANADTIIEDEDLHVSPGWIDIFADYREPGYEQKETIATGLAAAAAGGFTNVLLLPNTNPAIDSKSIVEFVQQKARGHAVKLFPLGALTKNIEGKNLAEMLDMHAHGAVAFTDGWKPVQNPNLLLKALEYVRAFDGIVIQLPADTALSAGGLMHEGPVSTRLGIAGIPALAETLFIHRDLELLRYTGSKLHITGVSTAEGLDMIRKAKAEGLHITCSVTPYHLVLTDEALTGYNSLYKVTPPLRPEADRLALIEGIKDGTVDCITSHHRPQDWDAKEKEFEYAADGMNVQEITFNIVWDAIGPEVGIEKLINLFSLTPRNIFGLKTDSIIKESKAELTIFTTKGHRTIEKDGLQSASHNNPFIDKKLVGKVIGIVNNTSIHINK